MKKERESGIVKFFNPRERWGFIKADNGQDVWVNYREIEDQGFRALEAGEPVEFEVQKDDRGRSKALRVIRTGSRKRGMVRDFDFAKGFGSIQAGDGTAPIFVHHTMIKREDGNKRFISLEAGDPVAFTPQPQDDGRLQAVDVVKLDARQALEKFAVLRDFDEHLATLADLSQPKESWDYKFSSSTTTVPILRSYLNYTFMRLHEQEKMRTATEKDGSPLTGFNTGLVTANQEEILAIFEENRGAREDEPKWFFKDFIKESDRRGIPLGRTPEMATYFDNPADVVFDPNLQLVVDRDHILNDDRHRFPADLQGDSGLTMRFDGAVAALNRRIRRNYKTAIPQWYRSKLQLLLPLCLLTPSRADLALVVERQPGSYYGWTVLPLDLAYNNARLVARPDTEWLIP